MKVPESRRALARALPLVKGPAWSFTKRDTNAIANAVDTVERLLLMAGELRTHSRTAVMATESVEEAANAVMAVRASAKERDASKGESPNDT